MRHIYLLSLGILLTLTESTATDCLKGYIIFRGKCADDDECKSEPPICGENATCHNTIGSYYCLCQEGFTPTHNFTQTDGIKCQDINECEDQSINCGPNTKCNNTVGSYFCTCETGYFSSNGKEMFSAGQGIQCIDRDECADPSTCGINATCHNTPGNFYCICAAGFSLKSGETNFTDPDESCMSVCDIDKSICGEGGVYHNSKDGHECVCRSGFTNYGHKQMKCTDRDECADPSICGINATCHNTPGNFYCICAAGFSLKSGETNFTNLHESCMRVCDIDKSICGEGGVCHNSKDSHECVCRSGFTNYGHKQMKCTDINECEDQSIDCGPNAECKNTEGSYSCTCKTGYFSSSGKKIFIAGQGIQCIGCDIIYSNFCIRQN